MKKEVEVLEKVNVTYQPHVLKNLQKVVDSRVKKEMVKQRKSWSDCEGWDCAKKVLQKVAELKNKFAEGPKRYFEFLQSTGYAILQEDNEHAIRERIKGPVSKYDHQVLRIQAGWGTCGKEKKWNWACTAKYTTKAYHLQRSLAQ